MLLSALLPHHRFLAGAWRKLMKYRRRKAILKKIAESEITPEERNPALRQFASDTVGMAERAGMPYPRVYVIESDQPNAFARALVRMYQCGW